eukprot:m.95249 g.95249  ORF g.95249 m.95249 type:complete len:54 (-) comp26801_c0_seq1:48-209(-)
MYAIGKVTFSAGGSNGVALQFTEIGVVETTTVIITMTKDTMIHKNTKVALSKQ